MNHWLILTVLTVFAMAGCKSTPASPKTKTPTPKSSTIAALHTWQGKLTAPRNGSTLPPRSGTILRSATEYTHFLDRIPTHRYEKRIKPQGPTPSDDPLLKRPAIDFSQYMLIVVENDDMWRPSTIQSVNKTADKIVVQVAPRGNPVILQSVIGVRSYTALKVERSPGTLVLQ